MNKVIVVVIAALGSGREVEERITPGAMLHSKLMKKVIPTPKYGRILL